MKIGKQQAVDFFTALGFGKAEGWTPKVLQERLSQIGDKVKAEKVPDDQKKMYDQVVKAGADITITDIGKDANPAAIDVDSLDSAALKALIVERKLPIKNPGKKELSVLRVEVKQALKMAGAKRSGVDRAVDSAAKKGKKSKPADEDGEDEEEEEEDGEEEEKKPKKDTVPRDEFGSAIDSIRGKVNATFSKEWKSESQIIEEAGVTIRQARIRLRRATKKGLLVKEKLIRYKLADDYKEILKSGGKEENGDAEGGEEEEGEEEGEE